MQIIISSLGEMFNSATAIMHWLSECAQIIAASDEPVQWTTPLGLPVVQPYRCLQVLSDKLEGTLAGRSLAFHSPSVLLLK